jgi:hypothetical protein
MLRLLAFVVVVSAANVASASGIIPLAQSRSVTVHGDATQYGDGCQSHYPPGTSIDDQFDESHDFGSADLSRSTYVQQHVGRASASAQLTSTAIGPHKLQIDIAADSDGWSDECADSHASSSAKFDIQFRVDKPGEYTATFLTPQYYRGIGLNFPSPVATLSDATGNVIFDTSHFAWFYWEDMPPAVIADTAGQWSGNSDFYNFKTSTITLTPGVYSLTGGATLTSVPSVISGDAPRATAYRFTLQQVLPEPSAWAMIVGAALCGLGQWPGIARRRVSAIRRVRMRRAI